MPAYSNYNRLSLALVSLNTGVLPLVSADLHQILFIKKLEARTKNFGESNKNGWIGFEK